MKFPFLLFGMLMLSSVALAESPRVQLKQMVEQLQKSPDDDALREKIIKLARTIKPALAVPKEAERRMARGTAAFKGAKSVTDYGDAANEFDQATLAAPWYADAYYNLGVAQDKAENYDAALRNLKLAQLASPGGKEIETLIYEVEYRNEKARLPQVEAAKQAQRERLEEEAMLKGLDGATFVWMNTLDGSELMENVLRITGDRIAWITTFKVISDWGRANKHYVGEVEAKESAPLVFAGRRFNYHNLNWEISSDGRTIRWTDAPGGTSAGYMAFVRR